MQNIMLIYSRKVLKFIIIKKIQNVIIFVMNSVIITNE